MAKLSARGRTIHVEAVREYSAATLQAAHDRMYPDKIGELALTIWERKTRRLMSDGKILEKIDLRFQPDQYDPAGRRHSVRLEGTRHAEGWSRGCRLCSHHGRTAKGWQPFAVGSHYDRLGRP